MLHCTSSIPKHVCRAASRTNYYLPSQWLTMLVRTTANDYLLCYSFCIKVEEWWSQLCCRKTCCQTRSFCLTPNKLLRKVPRQERQMNGVTTSLFWAFVDLSCWIISYMSSSRSWLSQWSSINKHSYYPEGRYSSAPGIQLQLARQW